MIVEGAEPVEKIRDDWVHAINDLLLQITDWSQAEGWQVRAVERTINEESIGSYRVLDLTIETGEREQLLLEVKGRGPAEASGRVQFSAWPTLFRVFLIYKPGGDKWSVRTDSGIPIRKAWNRETFIELARDLLSAEE